MTKSNIPSDLRDRWSTALVDVVNSQLLRGLPDGSPFGFTTNGYLDLRELEIKVFVKRVNLHRVDFSGCKKSWAGQFDFCTIQDCLFEEAILPTNLGGTFKSCNFSRASLKGSVLRGSFEKCDFGGVDLSGALGDGLTIRNCVFAEANLRKAQMTNCRFYECRFAGARFGSGSFARSEFISCDLRLSELNSTVIEGALVQK